MKQKQTSIKINGFVLEDTKELTEAKLFVINQIATNPIAFVNLQRLQFYIDDIIYNNE